MENQNEPTTAELSLIADPKTQELVKATSLESSKVLSYANSFAPFMSEVQDAMATLETINNEEPTKSDAKQARELRLKLVKVRSRATEAKKTLKENLISETRLIDGLYNVVTATSELTEADLMKIERHEENKRILAREALRKEREEVLAPYGINTAFYDLENMDEATFDDLVDKEDRAKTSRENEEAERAERQRIANEEAAALQENALKMAKRINRLSSLGMSYNESDKTYQRGTIKINSISVELLDDKVFSEHVFRLNNAIQAEIAKESLANKAKEAERLRLQTEADEAKARQAEELKKANEEAKRLATELAAERQREIDEAARIEKERKAAALAPDKEKLKVMFEALKAFEVPDFAGDECKKIGFVVTEALKELKKFIIRESKELV